MRTELFRIPTPFPGRLAIAPRPRGGDWLGEEIASWRESGVHTVVSLLTPGEVDAFELGQESAECESRGINYISLPIPDRGTPRPESGFEKLVAGVAEELSAGRGVVIHCRQGIGRAGLAAAAVLVAAGLDADGAVKAVSAA